jgi:hypothetical protein
LEVDENGKISGCIEISQEGEKSTNILIKEINTEVFINLEWRDEIIKSIQLIRLPLEKESIQEIQQLLQAKLDNSDPLPQENNSPLNTHSESREVRAIQTWNPFFAKFKAYTSFQGIFSSQRKVEMPPPVQSRNVSFMPMSRAVKK